VKTITYFKIENSKFKSCYGALSGGVLHLDDTTFEDNSSLFHCKLERIMIYYRQLSAEGRSNQGDKQ